MSSGNQYNASPSLAGYLFQCRLALLRSLQMTRQKPNGHISIERFDDIAFESDDIVQCLIQAKHQIDPKPLDDKSVDLWKTIRIWVEQFRQGILTTIDSRFLLITTSTAAVDSAMFYLRPESNKVSRDKAKELLIKAAKTSENKKTTEARNLFLSLNDQEKDAFLSRVEVLDKHPNLVDVMSEIEKELILLSPNNSSTLASYLEGWWLRVVAERLVADKSATIPIQNIIIKTNEIGNMFRPDTLPIDEPSLLKIKEYSEDDEESVFVKQMRIIELGENSIKRAVKDYYRASAQRSKWARENLLLDGESSRYDDDLKDRYERQREFKLELTPPSKDSEKIDLGKQLCLWASQQSIQFRNVVEVWITAGSYHGLANRLEIGWHPDFVDVMSEKGEDDNV